MTRMKVLFISSGLDARLGGPPISESQLVAYIKKFCDVEVLCPSNKLNTDFVLQRGLDNVQAFEPGEVYKAWTQKEHWIKEKVIEADIVHINGHWRWENYFFARMAVSNGTPYVLHPRGMCLVGHRKVLLKKVFNLFIGNYIVCRASKIIVLSRFESDQLYRYPVEMKKMAVIPNGIFPSDEKVISQEDVSEKKKSPYFLYIGRLESRKNLLFLLDAFAKYRIKGGKAELICVGPVEREYDKQIRERSIKLNIENEVKILPPVYGSKKWQIIRSALAVIYPSYGEPFGRVPFEAILVGAYPLVPDASGSAEYLRTHLEHSIYRHNSVNDLTEKLSFHADLREERDDLRKAQAWVMKEFHWQRITEKVFDLYQELLSKGQPLKQEPVASAL